MTILKDLWFNHPELVAGSCLVIMGGMAWAGAIWVLERFEAWVDGDDNT